MGLSVRMHRFLFLAALICGCLNAILGSTVSATDSSHGIPSETWGSNYGNTGYSSVTGMVTDSAGNTIFTGLIMPAGTSPVDYSTVKYGESGGLSWVRNFSEPMDMGNNLRFDAPELSEDIAADRAGNVIVTGYRYKFSDSECVTIKYSPEGAVRWIRKYDTATYDFCSVIASDDDGNIYVGVDSPGLADTARIIKYDINGNTVFVVPNVPGNPVSYIFDLAVDAAGNIYALAHKQSDTKTYLLVKWNASGSIAWLKPYFTGSLCGSSLAVSSNGIFVSSGVCGASDNKAIKTTKYDTQGNEIWTYNYSGDGGAYSLANISGIATDSGGSVYINGGLVNTAASRLITLKIDGEGGLAWEKWHGDGFAPYKITVDGTNHLYLGGRVVNVSTIGFQIRKYDQQQSSTIDLQAGTITASLAGSQIHIADSVSNAGNTSATGVTVHYYLSTDAGDAGITTADILLGVRTIDAISAGSSSAGDVTFSIPAGLAGGRYHIGMIVDPLNTVTESDEGNNSAIGNELVLPFPAPIAVVISSPAQGSCMNSRAVTVSGTVGNAIAPAVSAAGVSAMVSGNAFSVADVALVEGANVITVAATDAPGNSGSASVALTVDTVSPAVTGFTVMADPKLTLLIPLKIGFSEAPDMATIPPNIFITGKSGDVAGAFSLSGNDVLFMPSAEFRPNETYTVTVNNGVKDLCGNSLATVFAGSFETRIGPAFVHGEVYDDATGLPLAGAVIRMTSIDGDAPDPAIETTTDIMGRYGFEYNAGSGDAHIVIGRDGYTSAYRNAAVWPGRSFEVFDARLTPVASPASITVLGQQGLAGRLPSGWSPVYAVDVRSSGSTLALPGTLLIKNTYGFSGAGSVVAARFDEETSKWIASDISFEGENIAIGVNAAGQYALLVADTAPSVPPMPAGVGAPILPAATANPDTGNAVVEVTPPAVFSAIGARGLTSVVVTTPTPIPSGTAVRARITEKYDLSSGETVSKEPFDQDIVLYAWPIDGSDNTLSAGFPVTPSETYPLGTLRHGSVEIDVALAPQDASAGNVIGVAGGIVTGETGNVGLTIAASALLGDTSFTLNALAAPDLPPIDSSAPDFIGGIDLRMRGNGFAPDAVPEFTLPGALPADSDVIMTRAGMISGIPAQTVAAVGKISGGRVAITRCLSSPCIADGRYGFYVSPGQLAFISGQVFKSGAPASGVELRSQSLPFRYISDIGGGFTVVALAGSYAVSAIERGTGLESASSGSVSAGETALATLNLAVNPPVVASVTPFDKATGVDASARIEILFSKPVNPSTVTNASISLYQSVPGLAIPPVLVAGRASLVSGTRAVFTPESALRANAIYRLRVSSAITDSYGTPLSPVETVFTTAVVLGNAALEAGQLRAGLPDESGMMAISGGRGLAAPGSPVVLFNRTRNIVVTVTTDEDGSFTGTLAGAIGDKVDVYVEDLLGNVTVLDPGIFQNPDGSAAVGPEGGVMQGPGEIETYVPGGAFDEAMVIKVSAAAADLLEELTADPAVQSVGAFQIDTSGVRAKEELKISLPAPDWVTPDDQIIITKVVNFRGRDELTLVCPAVLRDGRIYSTSPPFDGVYDGGYYGVQVHLEDGVGYAMVDAWVVDELRTWIAGKAGLTFPVYKEVRRRFPVTVPVNKPFNVTLRGLDGTELRTVSIQGPTERGQMLPFVVHLTNDHTPPKPVKRSIPDDAVGILPWGDEYSITFDEPIAPESVNSETVKVTDSQGNAVVGVARLSGDGREIVFVPAYGYRYGETYTIAINGVKDNGGNELTGTTGRFTTFKPEVLSSVGSFPEAARLVKFNDRVAVMGHTRYGSFVLTNSYLSLVDVSDPYNPRNLGVGQVTETSDADARGKLLLQYANDIKAVENLPLTGINNADLSGDYIVTAGYTQWNYNGRTHRGRLGYIKSGQLSNPDSLVNDDLYLSWNPGNDDPPPPGAPYHRGEPMEMTIYGTNAYIANSGLGVQAVDLTQMAGNKAGAIGGTYSGSGTTAENLYNSISRAGDKILAVRGDELVILGTDLRPLGSFAGLNHAYGVTGVEKYPIDIDGDGNLGDYEDWDGDATTSAQESFDLALVSTSDGVVVIDVTEPGAANKLDLIGNARGRVKADREKRVGYANGGAVIFSLRHLRAGLDVSALDTAEDRVLYRSSEPGGAFDIS
ncbi:MAG: Ig-like domain-containing protein, partial [Nitrospirae bacterium]|nr:Ig-like domain-containing protein [Nitrospirota bacterium]